VIYPDDFDAHRDFSYGGDFEFNVEDLFFFVVYLVFDEESFEAKVKDGVGGYFIWEEGDRGEVI